MTAAHEGQAGFGLRNGLDVSGAGWQDLNVQNYESYIPLERMLYGLAEFEITGPEGRAICLSQLLDDASDLVAPAG